MNNLKIRSYKYSKKSITTRKNMKTRKTSKKMCKNKMKKANKRSTRYNRCSTRKNRGGAGEKEPATSTPTQKNKKATCPDDDMEPDNIVTELQKINDKLITLLSNGIPVPDTSGLENTINETKNKINGMIKSVKDTLMFPFTFVTDIKNKIVVEINNMLGDKFNLDFSNREELQRKVDEIDRNINKNPEIKKKIDKVIKDIGKPLEELIQKIQDKVLQLQQKVVSKLANSGANATISAINAIPFAGTLVSIAKIMDNVMAMLVRMSTVLKDGRMKNCEAAGIGKTIGIALGNVVTGVPGIGSILALIKVLDNILNIVETLTKSIDDIVSSTNEKLEKVMSAAKPLKGIMNQQTNELTKQATNKLPNQQTTTKPTKK